MQRALVGWGVCLFVVTDIGAVDVLGDVLGEIAGCIALGRVDHLPVEPGRDIGKGGGGHGDPHQLALVVGQGVVLQGADHRIAV